MTIKDIYVRQLRLICTYFRNTLLVFENVRDSDHCWTKEVSRMRIYPCLLRMVPVGTIRIMILQMLLQLLVLVLFQQLLVSESGILNSPSGRLAG